VWCTGCGCGNRCGSQALTGHPASSVAIAATVMSWMLCHSKGGCDMKLRGMPAGGAEVRLLEEEGRGLLAFDWQAACVASQAAHSSSAARSPHRTPCLAAR
jgi:hypothetical protein